jgi:phosphatidylglycerophosphatase A
VYDVWKPGPVRWLEENLPGGIGVVMDDVLAGVFGALTLAALVWLVPMVVGK